MTENTASATPTQQKSVSVIGLGLMGSALAHAFARGGCALTVWNRTPAKAAPFSGIARVARTVGEACAASTTVVVSLLDYEVSDGLLHQAEVEQALAGKLLIQLSTGTPADARRGEAWAKQYGIVYLDGAIMSYPHGIGSERATIYCAGPRAVFEQSRELLSLLAVKTIYCGEAIGAAAAVDMVLLDLFFGASAVLLHAAAICVAESVPLDDYVARGLLEGVAGLALTGVGTGDYPRGNSTMLTNAAGIRHIVRASEDARIDASFPNALLGWYTRAIERGHAADDIPSLYEAFRRP
jgi:3-hydroxyisobutyrate dehydrogenase-like beta-hydroxyacid dehydrogenase